jgi:competence protein ComEA
VPIGPTGRPVAVDGTSDGDLDDAVARLRAARSEAATAPLMPVAPAASPAPSAPRMPVAPAGPEHADDDLAERLRARRSARHVAAAYSAAHGHPLGLAGAAGEDGDEPGPRRWALGRRAAAVAGTAVLVIALAVAVVALWPRDGVEILASGVEPTAFEAPDAPPRPAPGPVSQSGAAGAEPPGAAAGVIVVHVVGQVAEPGVITLPAGARVGDALDAAGGATRRADLSAVNLARTVIDGEQVYVPRPGEQVPAAGGGPSWSGAAGGGGEGGLVDVNTADAATLETLPGIGPVLAERIVAWREENGPFASVDELGDVSGVGPSVLEQLRDAARV